MFDIEIIGAIDGLSHYQLEYIHTLLLLDAETVMLGNDFVGRPGTHIFANETDVIKIRTELNFDLKKARRWIVQTLEKEQEIAVHHPFKTWLLINKHEQINGQAESSILIASICPRLMPLHMTFKIAPSSPEQTQHYLQLLKTVFKMYLGLAKKTGHKLDEGLSNFGEAENGDVYYLDDEYYHWDNFVSFAIMLGVYIRTFEWLDETFIVDLSQLLVGQLTDIYHDSHCQVIIARQLQSLFMPAGHKEQLLTVMVKALGKIYAGAAVPDAKAVLKPYVYRHQPPERFFALLADIHSNYAALSCVLDYLRLRNINQGIVLGDIVGYGPEPRECIERLHDANFHIVKGNHDHAVAVGNADFGFSANAKAIINWTVGQLSEEERAWLNYLPAFEENEDWLAVHGAPMDPAFFYGYVYMMTSEDNLTYMQDKNIALCFHGHSHMPGAFVRDKNNMDHQIADYKIPLAHYKQALVCPGSVGQPRNGCTDTQFAVYDRELNEVNFVTLPYNNETVVQKMQQQDFPEVLWKRLLTGR